MYLFADGSFLSVEGYSEKAGREYYSASDALYIDGNGDGHYLSKRVDWEISNLERANPSWRDETIQSTCFIQITDERVTSDSRWKLPNNKKGEE